MSSVEDRDLGMKSILTHLEALENATVMVGVQGDETEDFLKIAAVQEFGSDPDGPTPGHIPERSYLRAFVDEKSAEIEIGMSRVTDLVLGGADALETLREFGIALEGGIKKRIQSRIDPANAESTIKRKGSDVPLIDKGRLVNSIRSKVILADGTAETTGAPADAAE